MGLNLKCAMGLGTGSPALYGDKTPAPPTPRHSHSPYTAQNAAISRLLRLLTLGIHPPLLHSSLKSHLMAMWGEHRSL